MKLNSLKLIILLFAFPIPGFSQDTLYVVLLSPKVGEVIDLQERDQFRIFSSIDNFIEATVLKSIHNNYFVKFLLTGQKDSIREYTEYSLRRMSEKINYFDEILNKTYIPGESIPDLVLTEKYVIFNNQISGQEPIRINRNSAKSTVKVPVNKNRPIGKSRLPFIGQEIPAYPGISFGVGLLYYDPDFSHIINAFRRIEQRYRDKGYPINQAMDFTLTPIITVMFNIAINEKINVMLEASVNNRKDSKYHSATISSSYYLLVYKRIKPFVSVGISKINYSVKQKYRERISETDEQNNYDFLDFLECKESGTGIQFTTGIDISFTEVVFRFYTGLTIAPIINQSIQGNFSDYWQGSKKFSMSSSLFGTQIMFNL